MSTYPDFVPVRRFQPTLALSPDGRDVVYSANTSGQFNLWRQTVDSPAEAVALTSFEHRSVREVVWSPDGQWLAFAADRDGDEFHQVHLMPAGGGEIRQLTDAPQVQHHLAGPASFSPDGERLLYAANDREPTDQDVIEHHLATDSRRRLVETEGYHFAAGYSPDGTRVAVAKLRSNTDTDLFVVDDSGLTHLTPHEGDAKFWPGPWAPSGDGLYTITDSGRDFTGLAIAPVPAGPMRWIETPGWDIEDVAVSLDGRVLAWVVNADGYSQLHVRDVREGADLTVPPLPGGTITALTASGDGKRLAFLLATPTRPADVAVVDLDAGTFRWLTDSRPPALTAVTPVEPSLVRYPTHDGRDIPALCYRPLGEGPFPVVLSIHGGPEAQERPGYAYAGLYQYLASRGIGVLAPNVRGSTGYGSAYQKLIHHDWGGAELHDFERAVAWLRSQDWVDGDRIAVFGGSFGGFATLSCVSRLPHLRWAAAVDIVGPANLVTFCRAVPPTWRRMMAAWVGDPDTEEEFLLARSPITYADDIVAPLFVIQGANDPRVVKPESDQIVERLRARGVDVRYDVYDDEGHGFTKRANEIRAFGDTAAFLEAHLLT